MSKEPLDLSSFTGTIQHVEYGVRNRSKHTCFNYDNGKTKVFYNLKDATFYCKKYWRGATWDIHEGIDKNAKCVAKSE
jgi:hypothetical protein